MVHFVMALSKKLLAEQLSVRGIPAAAFEIQQSFNDARLLLRSRGRSVKVSRPSSILFPSNIPADCRLMALFPGDGGHSF